jgi:hypothetical protein
MRPGRPRPGEQEEVEAEWKRVSGVRAARKMSPAATSTPLSMPGRCICPDASGQVLVASLDVCDLEPTARPANMQAPTNSTSGPMDMRAVSPVR